MRYIFVVGLPRTGTKLMVHVLESARNESVRIAAENFFLGRFMRRGVRHRLSRFGDLSEDDAVKSLASAMTEGRFWGRLWDRLASGEPAAAREELERRICATDRSSREIYRILLEFEGGPDADVVGDKSGPHLYRVPTLHRWFPDGLVVHTMRDPRALLASEMSKRLGRLRRRQESRDRGITRRFGDMVFRFLYSLLIVGYISVAWPWAAVLDRIYSRRYAGTYHRCRFEDLVLDHAETVPHLGRLLGLDLEPDDLAPPRVDSSYGSSSEVGFDSATTERWRESLPPLAHAWIWIVTIPWRRRLGY